MHAAPRVVIVAPALEGAALGALLEAEGFPTANATGAVAALRELRHGDVSAVVLDVGVAAGIDICRLLRAESSVAIVLVAGDAREADRVRALDLGADDVAAPTVSPAELAARIRAILRRSGVAHARALEVGDLRLDPAARRVAKAGREVALAPRQFDLLHVLMRHAGTVVRRDRIMSDVWDANWFGSTKTLDVHIAWLRAKIEDDPAHPRYITTVRGIGFRFASPDELADAV